MAKERKTPEQAFYEALSKFQSELPVVEKNKTVVVKMKAGGTYEYKYAELSFIWEKIREPFTKNGFSYSQKIKLENNFHLLETKIFHKSGHVESSELRLDYMGNDIKIAGGAISYWRRYSLSAALGIVTNEDAEEMMPEEDDNQFVKGLTDVQLEVIDSALSGVPDLRKVIVALYGTLNTIPEENFNEVLKTITDSKASSEKKDFLRKYGMDLKRTDYHEYIDSLVKQTGREFDFILDKAVQSESEFIDNFKKWKYQVGPEDE